MRSIDLGQSCAAQQQAVDAAHSPSYTHTLAHILHTVHTFTTLNCRVWYDLWKVRVCSAGRNQLRNESEKRWLVAETCRATKVVGVAVAEKETRWSVITRDSGWDAGWDAGWDLQVEMQVASRLASIFVMA